MNLQAVAVGNPAPDFTLLNEKGETWSLAERRGNVTLLLFYPANETVVCTKQLCSLRDNWQKYIDTKAEIVAVSPGTALENKEFAAKYRLPLSILADEDRVVTANYARHRLFPTSFMRAVAVVDSNGIIRTHQTMLRAFRPNDNDVIRAVYSARTDIFSAQSVELQTRIRKVILG